jgi:hypothetical protein
MAYIKLKKNHHRSDYIGQEPVPISPQDKNKRIQQAGFAYLEIAIWLSLVGSLALAERHIQKKSIEVKEKLIKEFVHEWNNIN